MNFAPAAAATSRSPVVSITMSAMIASRPAFVSQITPRMRPSCTIALENHECSRTFTPASAIISFETRFQPSGSNAAANTIGCGFTCARKSWQPQRAHLRYFSHDWPRSSGGG